MITYYDKYNKNFYKLVNINFESKSLNLVKIPHLSITALRLASDGFASAV